MRGAARVGLTSSGTAVAVGALSIVVLGAITGYSELTVLGVAGLVVVLVALMVPRMTSPVRFRRSNVPHFVERGSMLAVTLVAESDRTSPPTRIFEQLGGIAIPVDLPRITVDSPREIQYRVRAMRRGAHRLGPILEERSDPFMLATRRISNDVIDEIVVHPVVHRLTLPESASRARDALEALARLSDDPVSEFRSLREYVPGDDQRRIHWLSTAKTGTVLVRDTFQLRRATKAVILETLDTSSTDALFEDSVEIAASLVCEALRRDVTVSVRTRDHAAPGSHTPLRHREDALEVFGRVQRTLERDTIPAARVLWAGEPADQVILIAGASSPLIAQMCASATLRSRLLVIRMIDGSVAARRLPVRHVDVTSIADFLGRWRRGQVPA